MAGSSNPVQQTIEALAKERGIDPQVVVAAIEDAVLTASRKVFRGGENLKARFNPETGQVELVAVRTVVETMTTPATEIAIDEARNLYREAYGDEVADSIEIGDEMEFPKPTDQFGRIAAQTAKQVIFQKVREAEREHIFAEYNERIGEVVTGGVKRFENGDIIIEVGRIETVLPRKEQSRAESYAPGDRVRCVIRKVERSTKGPQIVLSRTDPALLIKLFEQEVPEIYDGTVVIKGAVREAGDRAKVAVYSRERDVDPVGACVGMKGTRVQAIIRELRGEKIDIVEYSEDPVYFVTNALSPAKVQRVTIVDDEERVVEVVVEDKQLSLAIGKKGQNVRLAAKLRSGRPARGRGHGVGRPHAARDSRRSRRGPAAGRLPVGGGHRRGRGAGAPAAGVRRRDHRSGPGGRACRPGGRVARGGRRRSGTGNRVDRVSLAEVSVVHRSDLQDRGVAQYHEPGNRRAAEA